MTCNTYERFFRKITTSDHPFVVHDVRVTHLFAHTVNKNNDKKKLKQYKCIIYTLFWPKFKFSKNWLSKWGVQDCREDERMFYGLYKKKKRYEYLTTGLRAKFVRHKSTWVFFNYFFYEN